MKKKSKSYPFWQVVPHVVILGAGASKAAFPNGDNYGKKLPLMNDIVEIIGLENLFKQNQIEYKNQNFEEVYHKIHSTKGSSQLVDQIDQMVRDYFTTLRIPDKVTFYDELILSLRKKDVIFSFNWDPLLMQAYSRNLIMQDLPDVHFLHGNVAMGACVQHKKAGYMGNHCSVCDRPYQPSKLLYPIKDKNYTSDPFISGEWKALEYSLEDSFLLTIFGYSAPKSDIAAKKMMLKAWDTNERKDFNEVEIIDLKTRDELHKTWKDFIVREHYVCRNSIRNSFAFSYARRSCDAYGSMIMMCDPWKQEQVPQFETVEQLQNWILPLIEEERRAAERNEMLKSSDLENLIN